MLQILPRVAPQKTLTCAATWSIHVILFHLGMIVALGAFLWTLETLVRLGVTCHVDRVTAILSLFGLSRTPTDPEDGWTKRKRQHGQCRRCWRRWRRWRRLEWWLYGQWLPWLRHDGLSLRWHGLWLRHGLPMRWHGLSLWRHDDADDARNGMAWYEMKCNMDCIAGTNIYGTTSETWKQNSKSRDGVCKKFIWIPYFVLAQKKWCQNVSRKL